VPAEQLPAPEVVRSYKDLARTERALSKGIEVSRIVGA